MKQKIFVRIICIVLAAALLLSVGFVAVSSFAANAAEIDDDSVGASSVTGYITDDYVNLRSGAGTGYSVVVCMRQNTKFTFVSTSLYNSNWYNIKLADGKKGYVHKDYVKKDENTADNSSLPTGYVTDDYVNLRSGAGTGYSVVVCMRKNTKFTFVSTSLYNSNWYNIKLSDGKNGYVHKDYIKKDTNTTSGEPSATVTLSNSSLILGVGDSYTLSKKISSPASSQTCTWSSSNTSVATVSSNGKVTAQKTGTAKITAKLSGGSTASCSLTVKSAPSSVSVSLSSLTLGAGETYTISEVTNSGSYAKNFTWSSSNTSVATVEKTTANKAKITAKKAGTANITVKTYNGKTASCKLTVKSAPSSVNVSKKSVSLNVGETSVIYEYTNSGSYAKNFTWSSSNTSIAKVEKTTANNAEITAVGEGTASITVKTYNGKTASCTVTVKTPPSSVKLSKSSASLYKDNQIILDATASGSVNWSSSNTSVATVSGGIVTAKSAGTATITAKCGSSSATCKVTVKSGSNVSISNSSVSIRMGKSVRLTSNSSVNWSTSDSRIATVKNGIVDTKGKGKVVITAYTSSGAATCLITVNGRDNVRFCYASPNSAPLNSTVTFKAITDTDRSAVRFVVSNGSTSYTVNAANKIKDGNNYIWTGSKNLSKSGKWTVKAYAKYKTSDDYLTTPVNGEGEVFVTSSTDKTTTVCAERRASDEVINLIADYEGFLTSVTADSITSDPTLGYGKVVTPGEQFYNNLTKNEAYAYLCQTVNSGGYTTRTNAYLLDNSIKFNQQQFDALVCFTYNVGAGVFANDSTIQSVLLNTGTGNSVAKGKSGFVNADSVNLRSGAGTSYSVLVCMDKNTKFTFVDGNVYNSNWYKIKLSSGVTGYIYKTYASVSGGSRDLNNINKQDYLDAFLQYHHAAGSCYWGLLYRRVDEAEVFFYGDYDRDGEYNYNNFKFTCYANKSFSIS